MNAKMGNDVIHLISRRKSVTCGCSYSAIHCIPLKHACLSNTFLAIFKTSQHWCSIIQNVGLPQMSRCNTTET